jgi:hypothetical protein
MRILVIGGTNFIGPHLVRRLVALGHELAFSAGPDPRRAAGLRADLPGIGIDCRIIETGFAALRSESSWTHDAPTPRTAGARRDVPGPGPEVVVLSMVTSTGPTGVSSAPSPGPWSHRRWRRMRPPFRSCSRT